MQNRLFNLPSNILSYIYEYDDTYLKYYKTHVMKELWHVLFMGINKEHFQDNKNEKRIIIDYFLSNNNHILNRLKNTIGEYEIGINNFEIFWDKKQVKLPDKESSLIPHDYLSAELHYINRGGITHILSCIVMTDEIYKNPEIDKIIHDFNGRLVWFNIDMTVTPDITHNIITFTSYSFNRFNSFMNTRFSE